MISSAANSATSPQESIANDSKTSDNDPKSTADDDSFNTAKSAATSIDDFNHSTDGGPKSNAECKFTDEPKFNIECNDEGDKTGKGFLTLPRKISGKISRFFKGRSQQNEIIAGFSCF